ncbi:MAG: cytochrome C [Candidatus Methanoperedenaceae archaeon]|nr:MAG: cytochrome C [Candidatus Methanoperedenaceae archaeon]
MVFFILLAAFGSAAIAYELSNEEKLGKNLFFDKNLSDPAGQACAACHAPEVGWTGPETKINAHGAVYEGAVDGRFGNRKPPASAYAGDSPILDNSTGIWIGGMFWDGRATGLTLGDPLAEQAQGPFLNPLEQNNPDASAVVNKVKASSYAMLFYDICNTGLTDAQYYECIARSIAAYERSAEVTSFTSKYDYYLKGNAALTSKEKRGLQLFEGKGKCNLCHVSTGEKPLFTDFTYDNLGVPRNPKNPFYNEPIYNPIGTAWVDKGLGGFLKSAGYPSSVYEPEFGKMKVPTLRNVDKRPYPGFVKAYGHNGYFKSLEEIVHFYNTRDVPGAGWKGKSWPPAEVSDNVNQNELGNLNLTRQEESDIVEFLKTLSDGYKPKK